MTYRWTRPNYESDGSIVVRLRLHPLLAASVQAYADEMNASLETAYHAFLKQLTAALKRDPSFMDSIWAEIFKAQRSTETVKAFTAKQLQIDHSRLAKNPKLTSGFVGVYVSGRGFKAMGKDPATKAEKYLGTFDDAAEAAWARYLHYKTNQLPYGALEAEMDKLRDDPHMAGKTEEEIRAAALEFFSATRSTNLLEPEDRDEADRLRRAELRAVLDNNKRMTPAARADLEAQMPPAPNNPPPNNLPRRIDRRGPLPQVDDSFFDRIPTDDDDDDSNQGDR